MAHMIISRNGFERKSLFWKAHLGKNNHKITSKIIAKTIKETDLNSKLHNGNLEEMSNIFRERLCRLHEIEPIMMHYVNPFGILGLVFVAKNISAIYQANVARPELKNFGITSQFNLKDKFWKLLHYSIITLHNYHC